MAEASAQRAGAAVLLLALALNADQAAATWTVTPDVTVRETYTNNVFFAGSTPISDFATQVTPGIRIDGSGPRFSATFRYNPTALFYARNPSQDYIANNLFTQGTLSAVERFFFVDFNGAIAQSFITPFAATPADLVNITPNRVENRSLGVSPYIRSQLGQYFTYELRNRNLWTHPTNNALADVHTQAWNANVTSAANQTTLLGWGLDYDQSRTSYGTLASRPPYESKIFRARLFAQPTGELRLNADVGREENNYSGDQQQQLSYYVRGVGAVWKPGPRTTAEAQYESRYFGPYRLLRFDHRTRLTAWNLTYSRDASNFQQQLLTLPPGNTAAALNQIFAARIADPLQRQAAVDQFRSSSGTPAFLTNPLSFYTQQIFLHEIVEGTGGMIGKRSSLLFTGFASKSTQITNGVGVDVPEAFVPGRVIDQVGGGVSATHQLTAFATLGATARRTFARQEGNPLGDSRNDFFTLNLTHTVSPKTSTFAGLSYTRFITDIPSPNDRARSAFVGLTHRF